MESARVEQKAMEFKLDLAEAKELRNLETEAVES